MNTNVYPDALGIDSINHADPLSKVGKIDILQDEVKRLSSLALYHTASNIEDIYQIAKSAHLYYTTRDIILYGLNSSDSNLGQKKMWEARLREVEDILSNSHPK